MIGTKLGPYEIREEVGRGGMAVVYRAYQPTVDRDVAIKVIMSNVAADPQSAQRFQREARLIARLEHPHILPVYDFDGAHDPPYIVMRYLDGGTLKEVMQQGVIPVGEIAYLMQQVISALDYAHRQGIVHRDIKPTNIMIDSEGNAFVADLGIARITGADGKVKQITQTGMVMGTPDYMSPEQALGMDDVDYKTDIYAVGVMLFQMLTGQLPYMGDTPMLTLMMHVQDPIPSAHARNPELPAAIDEVIVSAMAKKPADRFESIADMGIAVMKALGGISAISPIRVREAASATQIRHPDSESPTDSQITPNEQNKQVTALYVNAAEYAAIVDENDGSEASREAMQHLWQTFKRIVSDRDGIILSQTDNEMLAVWGATTAHEDDNERAIFAALSMQSVLNLVGERFLGGDTDDPLPLNIGINSGQVLLTPGQTAGTYAASGATISLANRLMQNAEGMILISHDVYRQARGVFSIELGDPIKVRGSKSIITTYKVLGAKARAFRVVTRGVESVETAMIGRDAELKQLQNAFLNAVEDGEMQVITIISDAGIGKSRLMYEYSKWSDLRPEGFRIFEGRATASSTDRPYALIRDLISFRFEILDTDKPQVVMQKLETGVSELVGKNGEMAHLIGQLCGFDLSESPYIKGILGDPAQLSSRARQLFIRFITMITEKLPVGMELEDIHYADDASLDLLNELFTTADEIPLLVVCLARPSLFDRRPTWGSGQRFHKRIDLKPLDKRESRDLVREILQKVEDIPRTLRDMLVDRAEGNPYYLEELVKMLIDDRVIIKESDEVWRVEESRISTLDVPSTLLGLLEARLDTLLYPEKLTLQRAAVIGRIFYDTALMALDKADETHILDLPPVLKKLEEREFIHRRETTQFEGSIEYIFAGNMLRDSLYNALLRRQLVTYNRATAEWLTAASGQRADEFAPLIADYYEKAGETALAGEILVAAARRGFSVGAFADGLRLAERARDILPDDSRVLLLLGEIRIRLGDYANAQELVENALTNAKTEVQRVATLTVLGEFTSELGDYVTARKELEEALALARKLDNRAMLARVLYSIADICWRTGSPDTRGFLDESLNIAREINDPIREMFALNRLGTLAMSEGKEEESEQYLTTCLERAHETGNREREMVALNNLGELNKLRQKLQDAKSCYERAIALASEAGARIDIAVYQLNVGEIELQLGDLKTARTHMLDSLKRATEAGAAVWIVASVIYIARLIAVEGDTDRALALMGMAQVQPAYTSEDQTEVEATLAMLKLPDEVVKTGMEKGKSLDLNIAVRELLAAAPV